MNSKHLFAAAALAVIGASAAAQEAAPDTWQQVRSVKSAEQVRAELAQARKDGTLEATDTTWQQVRSTMTVEQVRAELAQARKDGTLEATGSEANAFAPYRWAPLLAGTR